MAAQASYLAVLPRQEREPASFDDHRCNLLCWPRGGVSLNESLHASTISDARAGISSLLNGAKKCWRCVNLLYMLYTGYLAKARALQGRLFRLVDRKVSIVNRLRSMPSYCLFILFCAYDS